MALLNWTDELSVGVMMIDQQHQQLLGMLNDLNEAMLHGQGREVLQTLLNRLVQYTRLHFTTEERAMAKWDYPGLGAHRAEHERLTKKVLEFKAAFDAGRTTITVPLLSFLKDWLVGHIMGVDKLYSPCAVR